VSDDSLLYIYYITTYYYKCFFRKHNFSNLFTKKYLFEYTEILRLKQSLLRLQLEFKIVIVFLKQIAV